MNEVQCLGDLPVGPGCAPGAGLPHEWYEEQLHSFDLCNCSSKFNAKYFMLMACAGTLNT